MRPIHTPAQAESQTMRARMYRTWTLWGYGAMAVIGLLAILVTIIAPDVWNAIQLPIIAVFAAVVIVSAVFRLRGKQLS